MRQNLGVGQRSLSCQNTIDAFHQESVSSFLSDVCCRHLIPKHRCACEVGVVRSHFCLQTQLGSRPNSSYQTSKVCSCLPHPLVNLSVSGKVAGSGVAKMWELMDDIEFSHRWW